jgi:hypothetical protein
MAEGFKIADAYVDVETRYNEAATKVDAQRAGADSAVAYERKFDDILKDRVRRRDGTGRFVSERETDRTGSRIGSRFARSLLRAGGSTITGLAKTLFTPKLTGAIGGGLMSFAKSPVGLAAIASVAGVVGTLLASGIASTLSAAMVGGFGLGVIGLGAWLLREDKGIQKAAKRLGENASKIFTKAAKPMARPFRIVLDAFNNMLTRQAPAISRIFANMSKAIEPLGRGLIGFLEALMPSFERLSVVSADFLIALGDKLPGIGRSIGGFLDKIAANWPAIQAGFMAFMSDVGGVIGALASAFVWLAANYEKVRGWTVKLVQISQPVLTLALKIYEAFRWLYDQLVGNSIVPDMVNGIIRWFALLPGRVLGVLASLPGRVISLFVRLASGVISRVASLVSGAISRLATLPGRAVSAVSSIVGRVSGVLNSAVSAARTRASQLVNGFVSIVAQLAGKARAQAGRVKGAITGAFSGAGSWLRSAGSNILNGLIGGIQSAIGRLRSTLGGITGMIPDWKGPAERDAKLLEPNGRRILQGLQRGIQRQVPALRAQLGAITGDVPDMTVGGTGAPTAPAGTGAGVNIANLNVTVTGIIDPKDPLAARRFAAWVHGALAQYQRDYA